MSQGLVVPAPKGSKELQKKNTGAKMDALILRSILNGWSKGTVCRKICEAKWPGQNGYSKRQRNIAVRIYRSRVNTQEFRDKLFERGMADVDVRTALIMEAMVQKALKGTVSAARFVMEVTGRYRPQDHDQTPAVINFSFGDVPRPVGLLSMAEITGSTEVEEADYTEIAIRPAPQDGTGSTEEAVD